MKKTKRITALFLTLLMLLTHSTLVMASTLEYHRGSSGDGVDILSDLMRGSKKPSTSKVKNLANETYDYKVTSIGARVYTNYWFTGTETIGVIVDNWSKISGSADNNNLTVKLYNNKSLIQTSTRNMEEEGGMTVVDFQNLDANEKYYVLFEVPTNGNRFSFDGYITQ